jgi:type IV pilus assembly protein PilV
VRRAQAVRAIEDLAERIKANPGGFGQVGAGSYASDWNADTASADNGCSSQACSPGELARSDLMRWKSNLAEVLPMGKASVFTSSDEGADAANGRQIGIMVGWRANERAHAGDDAFSTAFRVNAAGVGCPEELICHLVYVQP